MATNKEIRKLLRTHLGMDVAKAQYWSDKTSKLRSDVRNHRDSIIARVVEIRAATNNGGSDSLEAKKLELLERQVVAQEAMSMSSNNQTLRETEAKRSNSLVEAKAKADSILADVEELDKVINETRDWNNASDIAAVSYTHLTLPTILLV